jgi:transcription elongation factor Elf1
MTEFLEPKIESLVEALNSWEGIKTYSSCEGHNLHGSGPGPYVTFSCDDIKILGAISRKLIGTSWKIVLDDIAISKKAIHYTLRYVFEDLYESLNFEKMQAEIPRIAELIKKGASDKPQVIEDMFPVLRCPECNKNSFLIKSNMMLSFGYESNTLNPKLLVYSNSHGKICCDNCGSELDFQNPIDKIMELITRTHIRGKILRRVSKKDLKE